MPPAAAMWSARAIRPNLPPFGALAILVTEPAPSFRISIRPAAHRGGEMRSRSDDDRSPPMLRCNAERMHGGLSAAVAR
jgi:hypothetical protein